MVSQPAQQLIDDLISGHVRSRRQAGRRETRQRPAHTNTHTQCPYLFVCIKTFRVTATSRATDRPAVTRYVMMTLVLNLCLIACDLMADCACVCCRIMHVHSTSCTVIALYFAGLLVCHNNKTSAGSCLKFHPENTKYVSS